MNDIVKIVQALEDSNILLKGESIFLGYLAHLFAYTLIQNEKHIFHK